MAQTCIANRQREKNDNEQQHGSIKHAQTTSKIQQRSLVVGPGELAVNPAPIILPT
jgi:hypothetical protein